ncbi:MAG: Acetylornithine aminotransferase [Candidatus Roizmanbacteria bacterium GW2011_GWA2_32_13]|uniref:Acetylornithine aminotransferase n=1 Tax=Candidatus Roizmanbacteria bacterium GW2011_GWA2_32_13 TaxID=1618475 RepID=A0A0F9Z1P8_9BACT|nr:MAG: Acetylornithine aminotransferase [Candidatus Roizmanbacteria bacterium GW2011_GWA2_32_13]
MNTIKIENKYQLPTYEKFPLVINKGKGCYVWDEKGNKYLDFYGGHAVALVGHCHPAIVKAVSEQLKKLIFYSNVVYNPQRAVAAKLLVELSKGKFASVFFCNSGTEANETALKLAKKFTKKDGIISFIGSFHGRTIGSLSITGFEKYHKDIGSLMPNVKFAQLGNIESVKKLVTNNTATIILEPIQSIAGINEAPSDFYIQLKQLCEEKGIVLIFDEVQTGLGRTGKMFYGEHYKITPDIITLAKGIAGGLPAGAVLVSKKVLTSVKLNDHGSTFGGSPVICEAIIATIQIIKQKKLVGNAHKMGQILIKEITKLPHIIKVHGKGMLLGIELDIPAKLVQTILLKEKIITGISANSKILRLMPPLIITEQDTQLFINKLKIVLQKI